MPEDNKKLNNIRHSLAHLLAAAVLEKYPGVKLGIGPVIENGFYYDFLFPEDVLINENFIEISNNKSVAGDQKTISYKLI